MRNFNNMFAFTQVFRQITTSKVSSKPKLKQKKAIEIQIP